ncbi:DNA methyltransferase [Methylobacterium longum]|uniref:Methyltransferase n=1 Tax=Methylobacterium longum TaxID=767694 RepID=A0ABT8AR58_9HYPH|nr:DNA methyltransferase [Methylobacterium longum]MDN3572393.1 DNA methyltransferase [Methylobacterium longum]GJE09465.1 hypothetical protein FOHLNKBM_0489 [Methylobacterium longum]
MSAAILGSAIQATRLAQKRSQEELAGLAALSPNTVMGLEQGRGTVASFVSVLRAMKSRLAYHNNPLTLGQHIALQRKKRRLSLDLVAERANLTRPTVTKIEKSEGQVASLAAVLRVLGQPLKIVPAEIAPLTPPETPAEPPSPIHLAVLGDCCNVMPSLKAGSIDLVFTSPPYNAGKSYEPTRTPEEYSDFARDWTACLPDLLTPTGSVWLNIGYMKVHGQSISLAYIYFPIMKALGFKLVQEIIWHYNAGTTYHRRFAHRTERLMWWVKNMKRYTFNGDDVRDPLDIKKFDKRNSPLGTLPDDVWEFPRLPWNSPERFHPCQTPEPIIERIIKACSHPGETVLDPFGGGGSTPAVAEKLRRGHISIELDPHYFEVMQTRCPSLRVRGSD